jgi:hypothetical protein
MGKDAAWSRSRPLFNADASLIDPELTALVG